MLSAQDKKAIKQKINSNKHQLFLISIDEMDAIVRSSQASKKPKVQQAWQQLKSNIEVGANYTASASDIGTLTKLVGDLGGFGVKAYVKTYGGKPHIILKGRPGLRKILTGTKYGIKNPKVVTMGLGKAGAIGAAKMGGMISIVLLSAYRVIDYLLTDQATLNQLVGSLAVDIVKVGITTGASIAAVYVAVAITTLAIGPIIAVIVVGVAVTTALNMLDTRYGITNRVIAGLDELESNTAAFINKKKQNLQNIANNTIDSVIDYAVDSAKRIVINFAHHYFNKLISSPRLN